MSGTWTYNSHTIATLDISLVSGSQGLGFYLLVPNIKVVMHTRPAPDTVSVTDVAGEMYASGKDNAERYLGRLRPFGLFPSLETAEYTHDTYISLQLDLDDRRIEALERIRSGGDLHLKIRLVGWARNVADERPHSVSCDLVYRADQSEWLALLGTIGYRRTMLLEIPLIEDEVDPRFPEVAEHLKAAQTHLLRGQNREAVGACRDVLESLSVAMNDSDFRPTGELAPPFSNFRDLRKEDRIRLVRYAAKILTHPARHVDEGPSRMEWGPTDARAVIAMASALVQMASEDQL